LLVATYVDDGTLAWDQPVIDAWPGFRAPTDELTRSLRVRDLLGMASGIAEPPALSALHEGDPTATQLLQSVVNLPVIGPPNSQYFYNNTVYAIGRLPTVSRDRGDRDRLAGRVRRCHARPRVRTGGNACGDDRR
jgi:CubicO group peptidase (beta-lactamase class C family)